MVDEDDTDMTMYQMMEKWTTDFQGLEINKSAFHTFLKENCKISCKKSYFYPEERNSPAKVEERREWVKDLLETDIDYESNCVFFDEAELHINLIRTFSWSRAIVTTPKSKAKNTTILGAISNHGVVNVKVRVPKVEVIKKRKLGKRKEGQHSWYHGSV
ncbi:MAG: hypothetical protein EXX96DRAFT_268823 [Benjaminiella poitrasii]|nr:MAG: hypothetical protein EXX96DRAFT_268823 [Benjaminiella poitrasii]